MKYCPNCGNELSEDSKFCSECGTDLTDHRNDSPVSTVATEEDVQELGESVEPTDDDGIVFWSIEYPSKAGIGSILVGGVLFLFAWLIIPLFIAMGYLIRTTANAAGAEAHPPDNFADWGGMFRDGIVLFVIFLVVGIVGVSISAIFFFIAAAVDAFAIMLLLIPIWLAIAYLSPAIYVNFAVERTFGAAFDIDALTDLAGTTTYLLGWFYYVVVINMIGAIFVAIVITLSFLTIIGWIIIIPMVYFYWYAIDAALWGRVYYKIDTA